MISHLREEIAHKFFVACDGFSRQRYGILGMHETNEFAWNRSSLMKQLVETVLT